MRRVVRRLLLGTGILLLTIVGTAGPASADPPRPTDYESRVLTVEPPLPHGVTVDIVGGDAFVELTVREGHEVLVPDYGDDAGERPPYLRFRPDGRVERNEAAAATAVNDSRYGSVDDRDGGDGTEGFEPDGEARWVTVATNGRYAWHDHRVHWMTSTPPAPIDDRGRIPLGGDDGTWTVPLVVDGEPTVVRGELLLLDPPSPLPWIALALLAATSVVGAAVRAQRHRRPIPYAHLAAALATVGLGAIAVAVTQWRHAPAASDPSALPVLVVITGTVAAASAASAAAVARARAQLVLLALAVATLGGWALLRREVLARAVLPTTLPFAADRAVTALVLGITAGLAIVLAWRPPTAPPVPRGSPGTTDP